MRHEARGMRRGTGWEQEAMARVRQPPGGCPGRAAARRQQPVAARMSAFIREASTETKEAPTSPHRHPPTPAPPARSLPPPTTTQPSLPRPPGSSPRLGHIAVLIRGAPAVVAAAVPEPQVIAHGDHERDRNADLRASVQRQAAGGGWWGGCAAQHMQEARNRMVWSPLPLTEWSL